MNKLLRLGVLVCVLAWVAPCGAVTLDATSSGESATSPLTFSHTVTASGGNRIIDVVCGLRSRTVVLTATYGGVSMTEIRRDQHPTSTAISSWAFRLVAPATGANNVVVSHSGGTLGLACGAISHTDVNQTTPIGDHDGFAGTCGGTDTLTLTVASTDVLVDGFTRSTVTTLSQGADQTEWFELTSNSSNTVAGSYQLGSVDGVMSYTPTATGGCAHSAFSLQHDAYVPLATGGIPLWFQ